MRSAKIVIALFGIISCGPTTTDQSSRTPASVKSLAINAPQGINPGPLDKDQNTRKLAEIAPESYVLRHGLLRAQGGKIVDANNERIQLKGMSLFWSQWSGSFWNGNAVREISRNWGATVVRAAMGVEEGGYLSNRQQEKNRVEAIVDAAMTEGIYVIIDWHDHNANRHTQDAVGFFSEMAQRYANNPHVIFEVFNEPVNISWGEVKNYSETIIRAIRAKGARNLVIVGSPEWSQRVDLAANDPIKDENVAYTLHFYASTHRQDLRNKASYAINKGLAIFVTEFGTCEASGNGYVDFNESNIWMDFMARNSIGWANWSLHDKAESCSALRPGSNPNGPWNDGQLTPSGAYIKGKMKN